MKAHMYWMQGWNNAPPRALRGLEAWKSAGFDVMCWDDETVKINWNKHIPAAMRADIVIAHAQYKFGGLAAGPDTLPLDVDSLKTSIDFLPEGVGQIIWQSKASWPTSSRPYNDLSYFPKGNKFIGAVSAQNKEVLKIDFTSTPKPINYTGPNSWAKLLKEYAQYVNVICGSKAFLKEPRVKEQSQVAWFDPGLAGDWYGKKPGQWE
jgi:hypothetical protein